MHMYSVYIHFFQHILELYTESFKTSWLFRFQCTVTSKSYVINHANSNENYFLVELVFLQLPPDFVLFIKTVSATELLTPHFIYTFL